MVLNTSGSAVLLFVWISNFPSLMSLVTENSADSIVSPALNIETPHSLKCLIN